MKLSAKIIDRFIKDPGKIASSMIDNFGPEVEAKILEYLNQQNAEHLNPNEKDLAVMLMANQEKTSIDALIISIDANGEPARVIFKNELLTLLKILTSKIKN